MYAATFGCNICAFWVHVYGSVGCKVCGCWVQSIWIILGVCMCWVHVCGNGWVQSLRMLGAKYTVVGCKVYGDVWVHVYAFWVHVYGLVGCMYAIVGCMYAVIGCMPDCR